jgi:hypothetical protein
MSDEAIREPLDGTASPTCQAAHEPCVDSAAHEL